MKPESRERSPGPGAPALVLVPGLDGTGLLFYQQIPRLARRFRVATFPLPDDPHCTMASLIEKLAAYCDELGAGRVLLCGESFGGALSMSFGLAHPERVSGLVIVNSFSRIDTRVRLRLAPIVLRALPWGTMPIVRRFTESQLHSPHARPEELREFHQRMHQVGRLGYIRRLEILAHYDLRTRLGSLPAPVLFIAGDRDRLVPAVREARFMAKRVPNGTLHVLEGYGHICLINRDLDLLEVIEPWYREHICDGPDLATGTPQKPMCDPGGADAD